MFGLSKNKNAQPVAFQMDTTVSSKKADHARRIVLVPTLIGSTMVMMPRPADNNSRDWMDAGR